MRPHPMAAVGMWCGLPTAGGRGTPFGFLLVLACPCRKEAVQPWFTKSNEEPGCHGHVCAGRVGIEPTPRLGCQVCCLLDRLPGEIAGRLSDDRPLATAPRNHRWPVFVIMAPAGLTLLAATTRSAPQMLCATLLGLAFLAGGVIEVIRFHCPCHLTIDFVGDGRIA
jgi:hypothetical protein